MLRSIDLNIYAQVGLVILIELAAENGILIVEVANQKLEQGLRITEEAQRSAEPDDHHHSPGWLPVLVVTNRADAPSQQQLGKVIFRGLVLSRVLSLEVKHKVCVLVKNVENRLFARQDASAQQAKA